MKTLFAFALLLAPAQVFASCESIIYVESRELSFGAYDTMSDGAITDAQFHGHYRSLAKSLALAKRCYDYASAHSCEAGTPPRTGIELHAGGSLRAVDPSDVNAHWILQNVHPRPADSTCVLWSTELGRFETDIAALEFLETVIPPVDTTAVAGRWNRKRDASILYSSCGGSWEPGTFLVHVGPSWVLRCGLYFTRDDAARAAKAWHGNVTVVRQRVDGPLLEQALAQPVDSE